MVRRKKQDQSFFVIEHKRNIMSGGSFLLRDFQRCAFCRLPTTLQTSTYGLRLPQAIVASTLAPPMREGGSSLYPSRRAANFKESVMRHWALSATTAGAAFLISSSGSASSPQGLISGSYFLDGERSDNYLQSIDSALPVRSLAGCARRPRLDMQSASRSQKDGSRSRSMTSD